MTPGTRGRGIIEGQVTDAAGQPLAGAKVAITAGDQPFREIAAVSDAAGRFRLGGLHPGSYTLEARAGQRSGAADVRVAAERTTATEIEVP